MLSFFFIFSLQNTLKFSEDAIFIEHVSFFNLIFSSKTELRKNFIYSHSDLLNQNNYLQTYKIISLKNSNILLFKSICKIFLYFIRKIYSENLEMNIYLNEFYFSQIYQFNKIFTVLQHLKSNIGKKILKYYFLNYYAIYKMVNELLKKHILYYNLNKSLKDLLEKTMHKIILYFFLVDFFNNFSIEKSIFFFENFEPISHKIYKNSIGQKINMSKKKIRNFFLNLKSEIKKCELEKKIKNFNEYIHDTNYSYKNKEYEYKDYLNDFFIICSHDNKYGSGFLNIDRNIIYDNHAHKYSFTHNLFEPIDITTLHKKFIIELFDENLKIYAKKIILKLKCEKCKILTNQILCADNLKYIMHNSHIDKYEILKFN